MTSANPPTRADELQGAASVPQEPLAAALRLAGDHPRPSRRLRLGALVLALAAHAALLYALALEPADDRAGGGGQQLDAIDVTIVNSTVLESCEAERAQPPVSAAADAVEANDGAAESTPAPQLPQQKKATAEEQQSQDELTLLTAAIVAVPPPTKQEDRKEAPTAAVAGGVAARGDAATAVTQSAPAAASPGAVREYARYVSQALAKTKPRGVGGFGTVKVKLVISPDGGLAAVQIAKSSGNRRLDDMALAAVQRAALPAPPPGMTADQLTYEVPYHFR